MKLLIICATVFLFSVGCSSGVVSSSLTLNDWRVDRIVVGDSVISIDGDDHPMLSFTSDSTFGGQTMCNSISGTYSTTQSGRITMSIDAISTAFCPDNTVEGVFIEQIALSHYFSVVGDTLQFKDSDGRTLLQLSRFK